MLGKGSGFPEGHSNAFGTGSRFSEGCSNAFGTGFRFLKGYSNVFEKDFRFSEWYSNAFGMGSGFSETVLTSSRHPRPIHAALQVTLEVVACPNVLGLCQLRVVLQ